MQPPYDGGEPPTQPQPAVPPPRRKRHWVRWTAAGAGALLVALIAAGVASNGDSKQAPAKPSHSATASATPVSQSTDVNGETCAAPDMTDGYCPGDTPTPDVTETRTVKQIVFKVWGSGQPDITYGSDSDNRDGGGHLGELGSGNALPWRRTLKFNENALYYFVTAQLNGSGDIKCAVVAKVTGYYSDGTHQTETETVASGHASGGYNICQAESS